MSIANSTGILSFSNDSASATPRDGIVGTVALAAGTDYIYCLAAAAIAAAGTVALTGSGTSTTTTTGSTYTHDVPAPGVAIGQYFWAKKVTSPF